MTRPPAATAVPLVLMATCWLSCTSSASNCNTDTERDVDGQCLLVCNSRVDCRGNEQCVDGTCRPGSGNTASSSSSSGAAGTSSAAGASSSVQVSSRAAMSSSTSGAVVSSSSASSSSSAATTMSASSAAMSQGGGSSEMALPGPSSAGGSSSAMASTSAGTTSSSAWPGCIVDSVMVPQGAYHPSNPCLFCDPSSSVTAYSAVPAGSDCDDDANPCTGRWECSNGACRDVAPAITCDNPGPCESASGASCDSRTGNCVYPQRANDAPCSDGLACTSRDTCQQGVCTAGPPNACDRLPLCKVSTGAYCMEPDGCVFPENAQDGTSCGSGLVCSAGECLPGCVVGDIFYEPGSQVGSVCRTCDPSVSTTTWTATNEGLSCGSAQRECCNGSCRLPEDCLALPEQ